MEYKKTLFNYALKLLGGRRYTVAGMEKKLAARAEKIYLAETGESASSSEEGADSRSPSNKVSTVIPEIIARLKDYKFLDDLEYATLYIRDTLSRKPQGTMMLKMKMTAKGLPKDIIAQALQTAEINETELAKTTVRKKLRTMRGKPIRFSGQNSSRNELNKKQKEKISHFLISRGFAYQSIAETLKAFPSDEAEDYQSL